MLEWIVQARRPETRAARIAETATRGRAQRARLPAAAEGVTASTQPGLRTISQTRITSAPRPTAASSSGRRLEASFACSSSSSSRGDLLGALEPLAQRVVEPGARRVHHEHRPDQHDVRRDHPRREQPARRPRPPRARRSPAAAARGTSPGWPGSTGRASRRSRRGCARSRIRNTTNIETPWASREQHDADRGAGRRATSTREDLPGLGRTADQKIIAGRASPGHGEARRRWWSPRLGGEPDAPGSPG